MAGERFERAALVKGWAREVGFDLVGVAGVGASQYGDAYRAWIAAGKQGDMDYLARGVEERVDLGKKFPWAKSVVCVGLAYWQNENPKSENGNPNNAGPAEGEALGRIARYAWGRDYHKVVEGKLRQLERRLREAFEAEEAREGRRLEIRAYCDTGPVLERELAARAGLGWVGKNTLLIHPRHGSWFLLGEMVLSLELEPDSSIGDHCGTCRRCIEACPTDAITEYSVDARKCISYLTLEHGRAGEAIDPALQGPMAEAGFLVGCDICQEVCPFNRRPLSTREPDFVVREPAPAVPLQTVLAWQEQEWDILTRGRASRRAKFAMWQRNARVLAKE